LNIDNDGWSFDDFQFSKAHRKMHKVKKKNVGTLGPTFGVHSELEVGIRKLRPYPFSKLALEPKF